MIRVQIQRRRIIGKPSTATSNRPWKILPEQSSTKENAYRPCPGIGNAKFTNGIENSQIERNFKERSTIGQEKKKKKKKKKKKESIFFGIEKGW